MARKQRSKAASVKDANVSLVEVTTKETSENVFARVITRAGKSKITRTYEIVPIANIDFRPTDNYRWGSKEEMDSDIHHGESAKSYGLLKRSINSGGVEEPVGVWPGGPGGKLRVIFGFTRVVAASEAKIKEIPVFIYPEDISTGERLLLQGRENSAALKREVSWTKDCEYIKRIAEAAGGMDSKGWDKVCAMLGRAKGTLSRMLRTYEAVPKSVKAAGSAGLISSSVAEFFYGKDGKGTHSNADAERIILSAATLKDGKQKSKVTLSDLQNAATALAEEGDVDVPEQRGTKVGNKPSSADLRDCIAALILAQIEEGGASEMSDELIDMIPESIDTCIALGLAQSVGDSPLFTKDGLDESEYEMENAREVNRMILNGFAENFFAETNAQIENSSGEEIEWIAGSGTDEDGKRMSNKKRVAELISAWVARDKVDVSDAKGKVKSVAATTALLVQGFVSELDEMVGQDTEPEIGE